MLPLQEGCCKRVNQGRPKGRMEGTKKSLNRSCDRNEIQGDFGKQLSCCCNLSFWESLSGNSLINVFYVAQRIRESSHNVRREAKRTFSQELTERRRARGLRTKRQQQQQLEPETTA